MVLPLGLLHSAEGHPMLVELKNGETYNGHLVNCDSFMNLTLREVIQTSVDGTKFMRLEECYIKGANVKYLRVPDEVLDIARTNMNKKKQNRDKNQLNKDLRRDNRNFKSRNQNQNYGQQQHNNSNQQVRRQ